MFAIGDMFLICEILELQLEGKSELVILHIGNAHSTNTYESISVKKSRK